MMTQYQKTCLALSIAVALSGCNQEDKVYVDPPEVIVNNPDPTPAPNRAPTARISVVYQKDQHLTLDGINSSDPDGNSLVRFYWKILEAPTNSNLVGRTFTSFDGTGQVMIDADQTGSYLIALQAYDGKLWSTPVEQRFELSAPPVVTLPPLNLGTRNYTTQTPLAQPVSLKNLDTAAGLRTCTLIQAPDGSRATVQLVDQRCDLTPDIAGEYTIHTDLRPASSPSGYYRQISKVYASTYSTPKALNFTPSQTVYSDALSRMVLLDGAASAMYFFDVTNQSLTRIRLPLIGHQLILSPDERTAFVLHDGFVSKIDVENAKRLSTIKLPNLNASSIAMLDTSTALVVASQGQRINDRYDSSTGQYTYDYQLAYATVDVTTGSSQLSSVILPKGSSQYYSSSSTFMLMQADQQIMLRTPQDNAAREMYWRVSSTDQKTIQATAITPSAKMASAPECNSSFYAGSTVLLSPQLLVRPCGDVYKMTSGSQLSFAAQFSTGVQHMDRHNTWQRVLVSPMISCCSNEPQNRLYEYHATMLTKERELVLPVMIDADEQTSYNTQAYKAFYTNDQGRHVVVLRVAPVIGTQNQYAISLSQ